eukprot:m.1144402 g.1144402  ORF g.1144402 m.1144402 type:complete len:369 (-) comp24462_c0_seq25:3411-4517(-)
MDTAVDNQAVSDCDDSTKVETCSQNTEVEDTATETIPAASFSGAKSSASARMSMAFDDDDDDEGDDGDVVSPVSTSDGLRQDSSQSDDGGETPTVVQFNIPKISFSTVEEEAVEGDANGTESNDARTTGDDSESYQRDDNTKEVVSSVGGNVTIFGAGEKNVAVGVALARKYGKQGSESERSDEVGGLPCSVSMSWRKDTYLASSLSVSYSDDKAREMEALLDAKHRVDALTGTTDVSRQAKKLLAEGDLIKVMRLSLVSKAAIAKQRRYILLDNVLLWAGYASKKSKKLVLKGRLDTGEYSVIDLPEQTSHGSSTLTNAFAINNCAKGKLNILITKSPEEKSTWLDAFRKCGVRLEDPVENSKGNHP